MPFPMFPYADAGPLYGCVPPSTISVSLTPGSAAEAGTIGLPVTASANAAAKMPTAAFLTSVVIATSSTALLARLWADRYRSGGWGGRFERRLRRRVAETVDDGQPPPHAALGGEKT